MDTYDWEDSIKNRADQLSDYKFDEPVFVGGVFMVNEEGAFTTTTDFDALSTIHRADILRDALHDLTELYNATVAKLQKSEA